MRACLLLAVGFLSATSIVHAATIYSIADIKLDGTAGENTFINNDNTSGAPPTGTTGGLATNGSTFTYTLNRSTAYSYFVSYFTAKTLTVGESLKLSYSFTPLSNTTFSTTTGSFRLGLFNSNGVYQTADTTSTSVVGAPALNAYRGYEALYGTSATLNAANTFNYRYGNNDNLWTSATRAAPAGAPSLSGIGTGDVTGYFMVTLLDAATIRLTSVINNGVAQTVDMSSNLYTTFDTLSFVAFPGNSSTQQTITFSDISIDYIAAVPEPAAIALILGSGLLLVIVRARRRRALA